MDWLSQALGISPAMGAPMAGPTFDDRFAPAAALPPAAPNPQFAASVLGPNPMIVGDAPTPSLGASLSGGGAGGPGGAPLDISTQGPGGPAPAAGMPRSGLLQALRGAQMPAAPEVQRVATPRPPERQPIASGELIRLLTSMGITPNDLPRYQR